MNKSTIVLGVLCVAVTATLVYNQAQLPEQVQQGSSDAVDIGLINPATVKNNTNKIGSVDSSIGTSAQVKVQLTKDPHVSDVSAIKDKNNHDYLASAHEKPADHRSDTQPKPHGHEHSIQRRNREDNSLIPPGEPKKSLPTQDDNY
jgi:hypothetical protein